ncbi:ThiF family adenylyltransferase [Trichocoleus sp. FACHB-591]|uniref:ThiF family adenylyltransferase n=1 Tax=Trichocoleus sp. FACHB-591 TaxID=2692872 RepID=UPI0016832427|nr:ThiF family adenylyltransferase [Trichocoleus sp. FACHB-591]MBD2095922.1 ThiF family adenylyltransferase [Trichocoleus sp. FACHB-591]
MTLRPFTGDFILPEKLRSPRARALHRYLNTKHSLYFQLIECRATKDFDILVVQVSVEVCQHRNIDIRSKEIVAISFKGDRDTLPGFYPLRFDFPIDLVHVMVDWSAEFPSLCLWGEPFEELRSRLTPYLLLARLKEWLEKTADGTLHDDEQPLEPVLLGYNDQVIIPGDATVSGKRYVAFRSEDAHRRTTLYFVEQRETTNEERPGFVLAAFTAPTITHRAVKYAPRNLEQLHSLLHEIGFDIKTELTKWAQQVRRYEDLVEARLVILIEFPKKRTETGLVESTEYWAFITTQSIAALGEALGTLVDAGSYGIQAVGVLLGENTISSDLKKIEIYALAVRRCLSSETLSVLSGYGEELRPSITAIGAGALGSKIIELAARCGFGQWSVIDKDIFLPHNLVRHVLGDWAVGTPKANALQDFVNDLVPDNPIGKVVVADVINPQNSQEIDDVFNNADLILDMSASVSVARQLCEHATNKRRASLFLSPSGKDIVLLLEDVERTTSLWDLEGIYYRALVSEDSLQGHLTDDPLTRYGNGCRDLTARISADQVSTLAGIGLRQLIQQYKDSNSSATVWRSNLQSGEVKAINLLSTPGFEIKLKNWRVRWNKGLLNELVTQRLESLPNETGGVLLGIVDLEHKMTVVAASIPAPADSVKRPHYFERGVTGLNDTLVETARKSAGQLRYIGEWHSHPNCVGARPSSDDEGVFAKLGEVFDETNEFYLMAILGDNELFVRIGLDGSFGEGSIFLSNSN